VQDQRPQTPGPCPRDRLAFAVSAVTSPFLVTALTAAVVVWLLRPGWQDLLLWAGIAALFSAVLPFLVVFALWRVGRVTDMHVALREQRTAPFVATLASAAVGLCVLRGVGAPPQVLALGVAFLVNGALLTLITLRWKISVHAATFAACILALGLVGATWALLGLALLPLVFWARLHRKRHTLMQGLVPVLLVAVTTPVAYEVAMAVMG
jgi:hypothetical protein